MKSFDREIARIVRNQFGVGPSMAVDHEVIYRNSDSAAYDRMKAEFDTGLAKRRDRAKVLRRSYVGKHFAVFLLAAYPLKDLDGIKPEFVKYYPICTREELDRLANPRSAADYLLKVRADAIADDVRLHRVFLRRRELKGGAWSLSSHFSFAEFDSYLSALPDSMRARCETVQAGRAFLREPNGMCIPTEWGPVIVVSESLEHYLYYMNLFLMSFELNDDEGRKFSVRDAPVALYLAIKTMMMTESPDFDLDPRGFASEPLHSKARAVARMQVDFVIGHEYAHILGGHLADTRISVTSDFTSNGTPAIEKIYSPEQQQELDADVGALINPEMNDMERDSMVIAAHWFFYGLDLLEEVANFLEPNRVSRQHPPSRERLIHLRSELAKRGLLDPQKFGSSDEMIATVQRLDKYRNSLRESFPSRVGLLKGYGSTYLPSRKGRKLLDHIDY